MEPSKRNASGPAAVRVGAHLNGGVSKAMAHADRIGLRDGPIQIFARSPSSWRTPRHSDATVARFRQGCRERGLEPAFIHGIYLMNFASRDQRISERSVQALSDELRIAARLGAAGVVVHPGAAGEWPVPAALDRAAAAMGACLTATEHEAANISLLLETCAGQGTTLGRSFEDLAGLLERLDHHPRLAICLDTCHLHAAGYALAPRSEHDLATEGAGVVQTATLEETLTVCAQTVGLSRVRLIHANDSKVPFGTNRDRHENIGYGTIGTAAFAAMLTHPHLHSLPFVLEVPGLDNEGPDAANLAALRRLAG